MRQTPLYIQLIVLILIAICITVGIVSAISLKYEIDLFIAFRDEPVKNKHGERNAINKREIETKAGDQHDGDKQLSMSPSKNVKPKADKPTKINFQTLEIDPYPFDFDPITGEQLPEQALIHTHNEREYRFANQANLDTFIEGPWNYEFKFDEWIKLMQEKRITQTCVVMPVRTVDDPNMTGPFDIVLGNRFYQVCCMACVQTFEASPEKFIKQINAWHEIDQRHHPRLKTCPVTKEDLTSIAAPYIVMLHHRLIAFKDESAFQVYLKTPAKFLPTGVSFESE